MPLFRWFEHMLEPTVPHPQVPPVAGVGKFYWHYARQARWLIVAMFAIGFAVALLDSAIPVFIGRVVTLLSTETPAALLHDAWPQLAAIAADHAWSCVRARGPYRRLITNKRSSRG